MFKINSYKNKTNESKSTFEMTFNSNLSFITNKSKIFPNIKEYKKKENLNKNKTYLKFRVNNIINELSKSYSYKKLLNPKNNFNNKFNHNENKKHKSFLNKSNSLNNFSNFRKNIIRDFSISNLSSESLKYNQINISKKNYIDFNYLLINKKKELEKIIINNARKFDEIKNKEEHKINNINNNNNNNFVKEIDYNKLSKQCLNEFYKFKSMKIKNNTILKFNEIKNLDCSDYEDLNLINKETILRKNLGLFSHKNLNRIIKIFNINKFNFDLDNDDLGDKNIKLLKTNLKKIELLVHSKSNEKQPKFIKEKLRNETIKKFRSLSGDLF